MTFRNNAINNGSACLFPRLFKNDFKIKMKRKVFHHDASFLVNKKSHLWEYLVEYSKFQGKSLNIIGSEPLSNGSNLSYLER